jgi:hypothetical protein
MPVYSRGSPSACSRARGGAGRRVGRCRRDLCRPRIARCRTGRTGERRTPRTALATARASLGARAGATRAETRDACTAPRAYRHRSSTAGREETRWFRSPSYAFREEEPYAVERGRAVRARFRFRRRVVPRRVAPPKWCSSRSSRPAAFGRRRAHIGLFRNRGSLAKRWRGLLVRVRPRVPACAGTCPAEAERADGNKMLGRNGGEVGAGGLQHAGGPCSARDERTGRPD